MRVLFIAPLIVACAIGCSKDSVTQKATAQSDRTPLPVTSKPAPVKEAPQVASLGDQEVRDLIRAGGKHWLSPTEYSIDKKHVGGDLLWIWPDGDRQIKVAKDGVLLVRVKWRLPPGQPLPMEADDGTVHFLVVSHFYSEESKRRFRALNTPVVFKPGTTEGFLDAKLEVKEEIEKGEILVFVRAMGKMSNLIVLRNVTFGD